MAKEQALPSRKSQTPSVGYYASKYGIIIAFFVICIAITIAEPRFLSVNNLFNVLRQTSVNGILAIGMTFVILTRGIDLSVGSVLAFAGVVAASVAQVPIQGEPMPWYLAVLAGMAAGAALGLVNGVLVARFAVPAFVATLGMLSTARGMTFIYADGQPISRLDPQFLELGRGLVMGIPVPIILFAIVFALAWFTLNRSTFGRHVYAVGGNERAAITSGISAWKVKLAVYVISGLCAGIAGVILTARTTAGLPQAGVTYELDAIAAVVIGGTSLAGGVGTVMGTLFGALIIGVINNGLDLLGVSSYYQQVIKGIIIVGAVLLDMSRRAREAA